MGAIGLMDMPADFRYRDVFLRGKPHHDRYDNFRIKHPSMGADQRAKIFSPFDALKGFGEAVASKNTLYTERIELNGRKKKDLDRRLRILKELTCNRKTARENRVNICVTYYIPCEDETSEFFGLKGRYITYSGVCWNVDEVYGTILVDREQISFEDILRIDSAEGIFQNEWTCESPEC